MKQKDIFKKEYNGMKEVTKRLLRLPRDVNNRTEIFTAKQRRDWLRANKKKTKELQTLEANRIIEIKLNTLNRTIKIIKNNSMRSDSEASERE